MNFTESNTIEQMITDTGDGALRFRSPASSGAAAILCNNEDVR